MPPDAAEQAASRVLATLMIHGRRGKAGEVTDFERLVGVLAYVEELVTGQHHHDEELWLLRPLEKHMAELRPRLARMRRDHISAGG